MTSAASPPQAKHYGMGLIAPCRAIDIDLAMPVQDIVVGVEYRGVLALVTDGDDPVGSLILPVRDGTLSACDVVRGVRRQLGREWLQVLARRRLEAPLPALGIDTVDELLAPAGASTGAALPAATVVICTRGRPFLLQRCLQAIAVQDLPDFEVVVVDNAPVDDAVKELVQASFPDFRYVVESRPGLSIARNRGIAEARGEIVAFTDDDAVPRPSWLRLLITHFAADTRVGMVTGLTAPLALDSEPQVMAESHRSMNRGYRRRRVRVDINIRPLDRRHYTPDRFGAGVNMALRKSSLEVAGCFDEHLGAGSGNRAGEDMDMSFRLLEAGYTQVYEPRAIVRHYHRDSWQGLKTQWNGWTRGYLAFLIRTVRREPAQRLPLAAFGLAQVGRLVRDAIKAAFYPSIVPASLARAEGLAAILALGEWLRRPTPLAAPGGKPVVAQRGTRRGSRTAVRVIDLGRPLEDLDDVREFDATLVHVTLDGRVLGSVRIDNRSAAISRAWLLDAVAGALSHRLLADSELYDARSLRARFLDRLLPARPNPEFVRPMNLIHRSLSVVIATRDRPEHLRACLESLATQDTPKSFQVVVVDNNPASGLTRPVAAGYPNVVLVEQSRGGTSAARNRGIHASDGELIAFIDDDVTVPRFWVNAVLRAFARSDVCAVTGNVLAASQSNPAQVTFENAYGFGRGFDVREYGPSFFDANRFAMPAVSNMGAGAMLCVRRAVLDESGWFPEHLGPGTATRAGEDLYFLYRLLRTSWTVLYSPHVCGWHYHRDNLPALYRQVFNYGMGVYAFYCATAVHDRELRSLGTMAIVYPVSQLRRLLRGGKASRSLVLIESLGNLIGPAAYAVSLGRSLLRGPSPDAGQAPAAEEPAAIGVAQGDRAPSSRESG